MAVIGIFFDMCLIFEHSITNNINMLHWQLACITICVAGCRQNTKWFLNAFVERNCKMKRKVAVVGIMGLMVGCGGEQVSKTRKSILPETSSGVNSPVASKGVTPVSDLCPVGMTYMSTNGINYCMAPETGCGPTSLCGAQTKMTCPTGTQAGMICTVPVGAIIVNPVVGSVGAGNPSSYTFLDTPNANLCLDAFIRAGTPVPDTAVARTIKNFNVRENGIAIQDMSTSTTPIVNIIELSSRLSNVVFQFLNPVGYYCIVKNDAVCSNVTIQRKCSAQMTEIEPITHVTVNKSEYTVKPRLCGFWPFQWTCNEDAGDLGGTTNSLNSEIRETPCIP